MTVLSPPHSEFLQYYRRLMRDADGQVPKRASVNPSDIKHLLPWIAMAERRGPYDVVPTIIGSAVDEFLQASFTGVNLFDYWNEALIEPMSQFYGNITDHPCGGYNIRILMGQSGLQRSYHSSLFPLVGRSGLIDRLIGVVSVAQVDPMLPEFGKPQDIETLNVAHISYINIGFGVPEGI